MSTYYNENDSLPGSTLSFPILKTLYSSKTPYQAIEVFETGTQYGKVLLLDGIVQLYEKDEFSYHELMVHPAMNTLKDVKNILVIGGGDGGTVRELSKYMEIERIDVMEIDIEVVNISKQFFPKVAKGFLDTRVNLIIGDAIENVRLSKDCEYDLIIIDGTDPFSIGEGLFGTSFHQQLRRVLKRDGAVVGFSGSPYAEYEQHSSCVKNFQDVYMKGNVNQYIGFVPMYTSGCWAFVLMNPNGVDLVEPKEDITTRYYDRDMHEALFKLPVFMRVS